MLIKPIVASKKKKSDFRSQPMNLLHVFINIFVSVLEKLHVISNS